MESGIGFSWHVPWVVLEYDVFANEAPLDRSRQTSHLYTGRTVVFNSLLSAILIKESPSQEYGLYVLTVPLLSTDTAVSCRTGAAQRRKAECGTLHDQMGRQDANRWNNVKFEAPSPEPVSPFNSEAGFIHWFLRFPVSGSRSFSDNA